ncbi:PilZ domain-containing protein [Oceanicoccus sp. KOV_DT_Chl]|uniref:PilZ domain-containing protein n=1 Tax=Oceanicoccus sp. KOV_DT_Chl TaxID=1904639 RepID=UPI000C7B41A4|nr:PilZ domain-containing protein [Oceanicoccus sp. KOV_DT_Chl]
MRRFVRHPTDIPIAVTVTAASSGCSMTSVSQGGLSCEVATQVAVGSMVNVAIPSVSPPYYGNAEVMWCRQCGEHFEIGLQFTDQEEAFKARMVQQVCQIEHYKNMVFEREGRWMDGDEAAAEWIQKYAADFSQH